jgi:5'-phosphate synthase pdxT subunit
VLGRVDGKIVLCRQGRFLAGSFHPELTDDRRLHRYFLEEIVMRLPHLA